MEFGDKENRTGCLIKNAIDRNELTFELRKKIEWARKKADWYDPFVEAYDELLQGADKERLSF